ncbi:hypothetical protein HYH03_003912 [Edaphochlamys debaryana]|nr:hypothetical protein HYH03_003912 [Edaphochlamys debaryana]|eukprot:KAG2498155.1 hypothetical protein HYH03_003912 [Edaphochlamys debaryana]
MKPAAVALLMERARAAGLSNVAGVRGMIEGFDTEPFDVCLALHACGNATDAALALAVARRAAYVVSPCCVGKLKFSLAGGSSFSPEHTDYTPRMPGDRPHRRTAPAAPSAPPSASASAPASASAAEPPAKEAAGQEPAAAPASATSSRPPPARAVEPADAGGSGTGGGGSGSAGGSSSNGGGGGGGGGSGSTRVVVGELQHPRSAWLRAHLPDPATTFRILAKVADQNHGSGGSASAGAAVQPADDPDSQQTTGRDAASAGAQSVAAAAAAACKAHVELDRNLAAAEEGYRVGLFRVLHWRDMAKGDLLVGVPGERAVWAELGALLEGAPGADVAQ